MNPLNTNDERGAEEGFDFKNILFLVVRQWQWFLLFAIIGFAGAYFYTKIKKPLYTVTASIMIPEKSSGVGIDMQNMFKGVVDQPQNNIFNQIEIITSYPPINQTLLNLRWGTSWSKKGLFIWQGIYKQEPFEVQEAPNFVNLRGLPIEITPTSQLTYTISGLGTAYVNNTLTEVKFEGTGTFGRPFINPWFNFTLSKKPSIDKIPEGRVPLCF